MSFSISSLSESQITEMIKNGVWSEDCPVHYKKLRSVSIIHFNFSGESGSGSLVVHESVAGQTLEIFQELHKQRFPVERIEPLENYGGDDIKSMDANNTSAFNGRKVMNTSRWSSYAFGMAIDLNPVQNPYLKVTSENATVRVFPTGGIHHINRNMIIPGKAEEVKEVFFDHGFKEWGGNWSDRPDYHHFQIPWEQIKKQFPDADI